MKKTSYVIGQAQVRFGGSIQVGVGYNKESKTAAIQFAEFKEQVNVGDKPTVAAYEPQVEFIFNNLESIKIVRQALDMCERAFKDEAMPIDKESEL